MRTRYFVVFNFWEKRREEIEVLNKHVKFKDINGIENLISLFVGTIFLEKNC